MKSIKKSLQSELINSKRIFRPTFSLLIGPNSILIPKYPKQKRKPSTEVSVFFFSTFLRKYNKSLGPD